MFASLIIHLFQLVFSVGTVFFSHNKSANGTFSHGPSVICPFSILHLDNVLLMVWQYVSGKFFCDETGGCPLLEIYLLK